MESRDRRVISLERLRECVLRDLGWLLNTGRLSQVQNLGAYPEVARSVLNYGSIDLSGRHLSSTDLAELENRREAGDRRIRTANSAGYAPSTFGPSKARR